MTHFKRTNARRIFIMLPLLVEDNPAFLPLLYLHSVILDSDESELLRFCTENRIKSESILLGYNVYGSTFTAPADICLKSWINSVFIEWMRKVRELKCAQHETNCKNRSKHTLTHNLNRIIIYCANFLCQTYRVYWTLNCAGISDAAVWSVSTGEPFLYLLKD